MKLLPFKAIFPNTKKYSFILNQEKLYVNDEASLKIDKINYNQYLLKQYKKGYFLKTFDEHIYLVKKETLNYSSIGIIAKINTDDLHSSKLKLHEETIKEKVFEYQDDLNKFNILTAPLILSYKNNPKINYYYKQIMKSHYNIKISGLNNNYYFWKLTNEELINSYFSKLNQFFIADGHHRISSLKTFSNQNTHAYAFFTSENFIQSKNITRYYINEYICKNTLNNLLEELNNKYDLLPTNHTLEKETHIILAYQNKLLKLNSQKINLIKEFLTEIYVRISNGKINFKNISGEIIHLVSDEQLILYIPGIIGKELINKHMLFPPHSTYFEPKFNNGIISILIKD